VTSLSDWEQFLRTAHPEAHLLQTAAWARLKSASGWRAAPVIAGKAGAMVLLRPLPLGFSIAYLPRGPLPATVDALAGLLPELDALCRAHKAAFLKIEPDLPDDPNTAGGLQRRGSEEEILARMKPKTRYNIRLAARRGVAVSEADDLDAFLRLLETTGSRDSFSVHSPSYYHRAYAEFSPQGSVVLLMAAYQEEPLAGLMAFAQGNRAWYLFGASSDLHRDVMAPHLLQWEAIRWARAKGCTEYDLWGIPDADEETLESQFPSRQDGLWGVYRFKRGFGGRIWRAVGAWDRVYFPPLYLLYRRWSACRTGSVG
jgi:peptidoglycan pentaglycine glycine transferase (the first glycine)